MSAAVGSIPSFTRNGVPRSSLRRSSSSEMRSTALAVSKRIWPAIFIRLRAPALYHLTTPDDCPGLRSAPGYPRPMTVTNECDESAEFGREAAVHRHERAVHE